MLPWDQKHQSWMMSYIWDTRHKLGKEEVTGIAKSQVNMNSFRLKAELKDYVSAHLPTPTPYSQQQPSGNLSLYLYLYFYYYFFDSRI
jgi:hypothetical protein